MSVTISKINYGIVVGPNAGATVSKANFGIVVGPNPGANISKLLLGIIVDTGTPEANARRRQMTMVN